jgi:precorrin-6A/cobalt-precorrin-6A reductase
MQNQENCYENVWILSGTSDGPNLANKLLELEYIVFASVVTNKAVKSYSKNPKLHIITGKLNSVDQIINFIKKNKIKFVVDATHPFALIISEYLHKACKQSNIPLFVFQRKSLVKKSNNFNFISSLKDIDKTNIENKNILLAIGSRFLDDTASHYMELGANLFSRVLPTPEGISKAFGSCIKNSNIAILEPSKNKESILEKKLCDFWQIDYILCRESGSYSQKIWESVASGSERRLFLVTKPKLKYVNPYFFSDYSSLINHITKEF